MQLLCPNHLRQWVRKCEWRRHDNANRLPPDRASGAKRVHRMVRTLLRAMSRLGLGRSCAERWQEADQRGATNEGGRTKIWIPGFAFGCRARRVSRMAV